MRLAIEGDVKTVLEFMQDNIPAARLVGVANCIVGLAPLLWGHHASEDVAALRLEGDPILPAGQTQLAASE